MAVKRILNGMRWKSFSNFTLRTEITLGSDTRMLRKRLDDEGLVDDVGYWLKSRIEHSLNTFLGMPMCLILTNFITLGNLLILNRDIVI